MPQKFILGQAVEYTPPRGLQAPPGIYVVIAKLSERDGAPMKSPAKCRRLTGLRFHIARGTLDRESGLKSQSAYRRFPLFATVNAVQGFV
jgi:hypothetical protein